MSCYFFDQLYPVHLKSEVFEAIGIVAVLCGTLLIAWAQTKRKKSLHERHGEKRSEHAFKHGPYRFLRTPTQIGLFFLILGLGLTIEIFWVPVFALLALIVNIGIFVKKQEHILAKRYGESYRLYKTKVRF